MHTHTEHFHIYVSSCGKRSQKVFLQSLTVDVFPAHQHILSQMCISARRKSNYTLVHICVHGYATVQGKCGASWPTFWGLTPSNCLGNPTSLAVTQSHTWMHHKHIHAHTHRSTHTHTHTDSNMFTALSFLSLLTFSFLVSFPSELHLQSVPKCFHFSPQTGSSWQFEKWSQNIIFGICLHRHHFSICAHTEE